MKKSFYIFSSGEFERKDNTVYFKSETGSKYIPIEDISEIMIFGEVNFNKRFIEFLSQKEVLLHFFNHYGYYAGSFYPREHLNSGYMILKQAEYYMDADKRLCLARHFVQGAAENIQHVLKYYINRGKDSLQAISDEIDKLYATTYECTGVEELMAIEGNIRDQYYKGFDTIIDKPAFTFEQRTRRPPQNRINTLISFGNSIIYTLVLSEIYKTHLDPRIGYLHTTNFRRFTLNLDVAEIFKPILVDRTIFTLLGKNMIAANDFQSYADGIILKEKAQKAFVTELDKRFATTINHRDLHRQVSYRSIIRMELYKLEKHFVGEKEYSPFVSRW
ncbi:type I-B CRISPR-associated endonuclease Cas1b [Mahella sp.]|uniref:type I-B CRISPR-associated endonuclease Cas1b n=1 Tax=Mahella sp. TaxID=2798721 RepID=UPI0025C04599|nr:type I-B CRISPR-associated endonuclease Cas1b [Mahella sp.]MBZ4665020.1 CRISPR-associated protein Cas1 family [Mahella sp.]MDK2903204.1 CRISP-associated protein Cas1 [Clostridiales bacterium]